MTHLRAEAEKVARRVLHVLHLIPDHMSYEQDLAETAEVILDFAQKHAAQAVKRARLEGRKEQELVLDDVRRELIAIHSRIDLGQRESAMSLVGLAVTTIDVAAEKLRAELGALERNDP